MNRKLSTVIFFLDYQQIICFTTNQNRTKNIRLNLHIFIITCRNACFGGIPIVGKIKTFTIIFCFIIRVFFTFRSVLSATPIIWCRKNTKISFMYRISTNSTNFFIANIFNNRQGWIFSKKTKTFPQPDQINEKLLQSKNSFLNTTIVRAVKLLNMICNFVFGS